MYLTVGANYLFERPHNFEMTAEVGFALQAYGLMDPTCPARARTSFARLRQ
jgi:hypothetical protein